MTWSLCKGDVKTIISLNSDCLSDKWSFKQWKFSNFLEVCDLIKKSNCSNVGWAFGWVV